MMKKERERGSVSVEMALLVLLIAAVLLGALNAGAAWRAKQVLENAAREGARLASVTPGLSPNDPAVLGLVDRILTAAGIPPAACTRAVEFQAPLRNGSPVTVNVSYLFKPVAGVSVPVVGNGVELKASSVMRYMRTARN